MKRTAVIALIIIGTMTLTACGSDNSTAKEAGRFPADLVALGDLPQPDQEQLQDQEEPETEIDGSLVTENINPGNTAAATTSQDKLRADSPGASGKDQNTSSNNGSSPAGNNSAAAPTNITAGSGNSDSDTQSSSSAGSSSGASGTGTTAPTEQHTHTWVTHEATGHYEERVVKEAWDETVYEDQERSICNQCGDDITGNTGSHTKSHALAGENGGWHSEWIVLEHTIHHEAETTQVWIEDTPAYTECSTCGAQK